MPPPFRRSISFHRAAPARRRDPALRSFLRGTIRRSIVPSIARGRHTCTTPRIAVLEWRMWTTIFSTQKGRTAQISKKRKTSSSDSRSDTTATRATICERERRDGKTDDERRRPSAAATANETKRRAPVVFRQTQRGDGSRCGDVNSNERGGPDDHLTSRRAATHTREIRAEAVSAACGAHVSFADETDELRPRCSRDERGALPR